MKECGSQIILSNTYHLLVQPGGEVIEKVRRVPLTRQEGGERHESWYNTEYGRISECHQLCPKMVCVMPVIPFVVQSEWPVIPVYITCEACLQRANLQLPP